MNDEERRRITEDGRWPLLKTKPDNLPPEREQSSGTRRQSRRGNASADGYPEEPQRRRNRDGASGRTQGGTQRQNQSRRRAEQQPDERQQTVRRAEPDRSARYRAEREDTGRERANRAAAGRTANGAENRNRRKRRQASEGESAAEFFREIPGRFRNFLKNPTGDIPFMIGVIIAAVLIVLIICLIVRAATGSGSSGKSDSTNAVSAVSVSATPTPAYTATDIKMSFVGDVLLGMDENTSYSSSLNAFYDLNGADYFLQNVKSVFSSDDLSIVNLEGTLTDETTRSDKTYAFKGDPAFVNILSDASIEAADLANDHTSDYGENSYTDTVSALESAGISHFGNEDVAVMTVRGITIGFYGIDQMDDSTGASASMTSAVQKLKDQNANIIIGYFHWGMDQDTCPTQEMVDLAHSAIDAGTDLVVGSGSHLLEGIEYYNNRTIAYGLGSFCFGGDTNPSDVRTMIFQPTFSISNQGTITNISLNIVPCQMCSDVNYNDYQPQILTGDDAQAVLDELDERSTEITNTFTDITTVYNSKTDGTAGVDGAGIGGETVSSDSTSAGDGTQTDSTAQSDSAEDTTGSTTTQ